VLPPAQNVIPLRPRRTLHAKATANDLPVSLQRLSSAVQELDDLRRCAERIVSNPQWSAIEWRAACTPLLLHLPRARRSLADLGRIRVGRWPDTGWAVRLRTACSKVERRLMDVGISMSAVSSKGTSNADTVITFSSETALLGEAAGELCGLIASHYPAAVNDKI
jgi:hypothetical protein